MLSAAYWYASSGTQVWCEAKILLSATYLIKTNERLVARLNLWSPLSKLHLSSSEPHVPALSESLCDTNKKPSEESRLLSSCYGHRSQYSKQSLSHQQKLPSNPCLPTLAQLLSCAIILRVTLLRLPSIIVLQVTLLQVTLLRVTVLQQF